MILFLNDTKSEEVRSDIRKNSTKKKDVQQEMSIFQYQPQNTKNYNTVIIDSFVIESFIVS